jgi:N-acyl-phosphatidylethanolamine-hydrolysing phospholipase D
MLIWIWTLTFLASNVTNMTKHNHTKTGFRNNYPIEIHGFSSLLKWQFSSIGKRGKILPFPVEKPDVEFIQQNRTKPQLVWVNHATFILQFEGVNILTDPIFSERCSPVQWAGPKRTTPPGLKIEELPQIDFIIISHDHYDHLDVESILAIQEKQKDNLPTWFVPLKIKAWFEELGVKNVVELDWWDKTEFAGWDIHCVPAQHFSGRGMTNRDGTLWAGWVLIKNDFRFYFAGDTGYSPDFKEIGERLGPFDLSCIPIGAYQPRWFMGGVHVDPIEAVEIHKDVKSKLTVGMHWGTFPLADEDMDEPPRILKEALQKNGLSENEFIVLKNGESITF